MDRLNAFIKSRSQHRMGQASIVFFSLFVLTNRIATDMDKSLVDISFKQLMLLILIEINEGGTFTELGAMMGSSRQNIKNLALLLQEKGYVTIEADPQDRRASRVVSTGKTQGHFQSQNQIYNQKLSDLFADFSDEEVNTIFRFMKKIFAGVERMEESHEENL